MKNLYDIIINPLITEKGSLLQAQCNQYHFKVHPKSNKQEIRQAIENIYNVKVTNVRTMRVRGKLKRVRYVQGRTAQWKKAVVTLKSGEKIEFV